MEGDLIQPFIYSTHIIQSELNLRFKVSMDKVTSSYK